jgi:hypothetical protein
MFLEEFMDVVVEVVELEVEHQTHLVKLVVQL